MKLKNLSLALGLLLALPSIGLISCGKKKEGYTVKVSVTDIGTAKVYRDTLKGGKYAEAKKTTAELAKAWEESGVPGKPAEVTLPTLSITIEKGGETIAAQSVTASKSGIEPKDLTTAGKKTEVTAKAEGSQVGDTTKALETAKKELKEKAAKTAATDKATLEEKKAWKESGAPSKPAEVTTLPTLSINIH